MKIFLIGMPGSGKTTLGKKLAEDQSLEFVDLDAEIEKAEGKSIPEIFRQLGEDHFRLVESKLLRQWAGSLRSFIMATGGGAPCFHQGIDIINEHGLSIFLDCPVTELLARVRKNSDRPLLASADEEELRKKLEGIRSARLACYQRAKIVVENPSVSALSREIKLRR